MSDSTAPKHGTTPSMKLTSSLLFISILAAPGLGLINRHAIVSRYNPVRTASSPTTPLQIGNGNFAFGADVTGLQTFLPFAILSSWGWKNDSLPPGKTQADVENYKGVSWLNHGRPVQYDFGGGNPIEQWLISNPNRVNLGRVGLVFKSSEGQILNLTERDLTAVRQELDLWTGKATSRMLFEGVPTMVKTACSPTESSIGLSVTSPLLKGGRLGVFLDFPWNDGKAKFSGPFVGNWNAAANHTTTLEVVKRGHVQSRIAHILDASTFVTSLGGAQFSITRDSLDLHRYTVMPKTADASFSLTINYATNDTMTEDIELTQDVFDVSSNSWRDFWTESGFVDVLTNSTDPRADELQRRIILSRYLMRVNEAGDTPPQESGLANNGWYGKFHMEMYFWHSAHWALWNNWDILQRSSSVYSRFLPSSISRAQVQQGWAAGARWPKMTDPSGRSSPGEINNLLLWQQPHPLVFAEYERRRFPERKTLQKWAEVVRNTADWMAAFAWYNATTNVYDLGPPEFVVSEDTSPNVTQNPAFELVYWGLGLGIAEAWMEGLGRRQGLAKLPVDNGAYSVYEGIESNFWDDPAYTSDHPALVGLHGRLPPTEGLDLDMAKATAEKVWTHWNQTDFWGWDFPMLAMSAARNGNASKAIEWLLNPLFAFDDVGMPTGGLRVPAPYFPGSGGLLYAVAMMAAGWDGSEGQAPGFPREGWRVQVEGINKAL